MQTKLPHAETAAVDSSADTPSLNPIMDDLSRRSFLFGMGALALSACGGGIDTARSPSRAAGAPDRLLAGTLASFVHPGLLHTAADFTRMAANINNEPWKSGWNKLLANSHAQLSWTARPVSIVYRGFDGTNPENYSRLYNDVAAAYACALRWKVSGDVNYANKAIEIMNAWSGMLTDIRGTTDSALAAGIYGYEFANAGEIMRTYGGWAAADFQRFQNMMRNVFYPINHDFLIRHNGTDWTHYWANWDLCQMASIMAIGVLCDDSAMFDEAVNYFLNGGGNGAAAQAVYYVHPGHLGQWQESGRDQGHSTLGIALMGALCEMAWNQGVDLYGFDNNRFLMGAEYVAKSNLIESGTTYYTVPYTRYTNVDRVNQTAFSTISQGNVRPCWALVVHHYVNRKGLAAPYSKRFMLQVQPEGGGGDYGSNSGGYDQLGYGTLTCTRSNISAGVPPSGLVGYVISNAIVLSWWGSAYATSYNVKRAASSSGPWTTIRSGVTDLLSFTDTTAGNGTWYYVVTAITPTGETAASNQAKVVKGTAVHTWLKFDETSGTTAADASGNGRHGSLLGSASWATGRVNGCLGLNGTSAYCALPPDVVKDLSDFTISAWVYWNAARTWDRVFDFGDDSHRYMMLTARGANGLARFAISLGGREGECFVDSNGALPRTAWTHVAVTLTGKTCTFYVNGTVTGSSTNMYLSPNQLGSTRNNWIGRSARNEPYFNGRIDEFRIHRVGLTQAQVVALMNGQPI